VATTTFKTIPEALQLADPVLKSSKTATAVDLLVNSALTAMLSL